MAFEKNLGQAADPAQFLARGRGYALYLDLGGAVLALHRDGDDFGEPAELWVRMKPVDSWAKPRMEAEGELPGKVNYLIGNDPGGWHTGVPTYARVRYRKVYPGIDLVFYGHGRLLEYDIEVAPGADPAAVKFGFEGIDALAVNADGALVLGFGAERLELRRPVAYQGDGESRVPVPAHYVVTGEREIAFQIGPYDPSIALVIDPVLDYATFLGGNSYDDANAVAADALGNIVIAGRTFSANFPTQDPIQPARGGSEGGDVFVSKFDSSGAALLFSTYLGGSGHDGATAVALDDAGNVYLTGRTESLNFPTTVGVVQGSHQAQQGSVVCAPNAFVTKLNATGSALVYSTYLGGSGNGLQGDSGTGIGVDALGNAYVGGFTSSADFPTASPFQAQLAGNFLMRSTNGGGTWAAVQTGLPRKEVLAITIDQKNPSNVYVSFQGGQLWKSTNGGNSWARIDGGAFGGGDIALIAVDPVNNDNVYAAGGDIGLQTSCVVTTVFKSDDAGVTWSVRNTGLPAGYALSSLEIDPLNPMVLYAGIAQYSAAGVLFKSTDGAATWTRSDTGITAFADNPRILVDPVTPSNVYAATAHWGLFKSTNAGASFSPLGNSFYDSDQPIALDPSNPSTLYEIGIFGLRKSTDGGQNWAETVSSPCPFVDPFGQCGFPFAFISSIVVDPADSDTIYVGSIIGVFKSADGGGSWLPAPIPGTHLPAVGTVVDDELYRPTGALLALDPSNPARVFVALARHPDAFLAKLNTNASALLYSTFLGGSNPDRGFALAVDGAGNAYLAGETQSQNFPSTAGSFQPAIAPDDCFFSPLNFSGGVAPCRDAFVAKLTPTGNALAYSTYLGGGNNEHARGVAIDGPGNTYLVGTTASDDFPVYSAFRSVLPAAASVYVAKLGPTGNALQYSTFLGAGSGQAIAADADGQATITGGTDAADFPLQEPIQCFHGADVFVTRFESSGAGLIYSTFMGGTGSDFGTGVALDAAGNAYVVGTTGSANFETMNPLFPVLGGSTDAFAARILAEGVSGSDIGVLKCQRSASGSFLNGFTTNIGDPIVYTLFVNNSGPADAIGVTVTDPLPAGMTLVSASPGCTGATTVNCTVGDLPADEGEVRILVATPTLPGMITNTATAAATSADPNAVNDVSQAKAQVIAGPLTLACPPPNAWRRNVLVVLGEIGLPFSATLTASGGTQPYSYSISGGLLPDGINLTAATGGLAGTPTKEEEARFTAKVTDSAGGGGQMKTANCRITVLEPIIFADSFEDL